MNISFLISYLLDQRLRYWITKGLQKLFHKHIPGLKITWDNSYFSMGLFFIFESILSTLYFVGSSVHSKQVADDYAVYSPCPLSTFCSHFKDQELH